jgi:hypothetical protein
MEGDYGLLLRGPPNGDKLTLRPRMYEVHDEAITMRAMRLL